MHRFQSLQHADDWQPYRDSVLLRDVDPAALLRQRPDESWLALDARGAPAARASLWWSEAPALAGERQGAIGPNGAVDAESAAALLHHLSARLRARQCTLAVGPMDGNTWRRYRFVTERGHAPPFFLEPENPAEYPQHFRDAGFQVLASYYSSVNEDLAVEDGRVGRARERLGAQGITLRSLRPDDFENELDRLYDLSVVAFRDNYLYTPISREEFVAQYRQVKPLLVPGLVCLAEADGETVGYGFCLPDISQQQRGEPVDTAIVKTVAVLPGRRQAGLGAWLVADVQQRARALGFRRAIHALMHESNRSRNISRHTAQSMRGYSLFAKRLAREET